MTTTEGATPQGRIVARRTFDREGGRLELEVQEPIQDPASAHGAWTCKVVVRRDGRCEESVVSGEDSLQALIVAIGNLRRVLREDIPSLRWVGELGFVGLPIVTEGYDPQETDYIEHLLETEARRRGLWMRDAMHFARRQRQVNDDDDDGN